VALSNARNEIVAIYDQALDVRSGPTACLKEIITLIRLGLRETSINPQQLVAIGMGVPGPVEYSSGLLIAPPIMPAWGGYAVRDHLVEEFGTQVFIDNEVNLMALGEMWSSEAIMNNALFVKVGTGIGSGILCNGAIYRGADGAAGDIGHVCADEHGPRCSCGNTGCLEALASGAAIAAQAQEAAAAGKSELLAQLCREKGSLTLADVGKAVKEGDQEATRIIKESGQRVGQVLAGLVNFFNPERIMIGGSITQTGYLFLAAVRHAIYNRSLPLSTRHLAIEYSQLEGQAGVSGAVILAWQELFSNPYATAHL
jgi:predicted NBD/HSP70 family sugar kinase